MSKRHGRDLPPQPRGRPDKFTLERRQSIINDISRGIPYILAAESNGICEDTLYDWLNKGRIDIAAGINSDYAIFSESIKNAEKAKIDRHLSNIEDKPERWQADAWILERRWWQHFSPNAAVVEFNKKLEKLERQGGAQHVEALKSEAKEITEK